MATEVFVHGVTKTNNDVAQAYHFFVRKIKYSNALNVSVSGRGVLS